MAGPAIADAVWRGMGAAAHAIGKAFDLHRADGPLCPVRPSTIRMRLPAYFAPQRAELPAHGHPLYEGVFDASYSQPGDYLVAGEDIFFLLSQRALQIVLCARATRLVSFLRAPAGQSAGGLGGYGGLVRGQAMPLLTAWPASVAPASGGLDRAGLPADTPLAGLSVLLPAIPAVTLRTGDVMTDEIGRAGVIAEAELSSHGWRLLVRQAAT